MDIATLVHETANAPGTNVTFNLAGPVAGRRSFAMAFASGRVPFYVMTDGVQSEWGAGTFTAGSPNQLSRTTVIGNSANTTARLNFTGAVDVYNAFPAEELSRLNSGLLFGEIKAYGGATIPAGWLPCGGQAVSRTTYAALFAAIGTTWGAGDGSTTFNVPDLCGRTLVGKDDMGGSAKNRVTTGGSGIDGVTLGAAGGDQRLQAHPHGVNDPGHPHGVNDPGHPHGIGPVVTDVVGTDLNYIAIGNNFALTKTGSTAGALTGISIQNAATGISIQNAGAGNSQNMPPAAVVNWLIFAGV